MSHVPADNPSDGDSRSWAGLLLPWLMSGTTHLALLLVLALTWERATGAGDSSFNMRGASLRVAVISRSSVDQEGLEDGTEIDGGRFFDDERTEQPPTGPVPQQTPQFPVAQANGEKTGGRGGIQSAIAIGPQPPVNLPGILPAANSTVGYPGANGPEGEGPGGVGPSGVGDPRDFARQSQPGSRGAKLRGGYTRTGVFGVEGEGAKFVYVFDRSGSMDGHGGLPLAMAKAELISSLKDLGQTHQFQIIFYNEHPRIFNLAGSPGRLVFGNDYNKMQAQRFVGSITADGATQHEEALVTALRMAPDVIFFLTDADEPRMSLQQLARINKLNPGTQINAIEFGYGPQSDPNNFLVELARQNAGRHVYIDVSRLGRAS